MMRRVLPHFMLSLAALAACSGLTQAYIVGGPRGLEEMTKQADIIFKGTALASEAVQDDQLAPLGSHVAWETQFKVVSVIKGDKPGDKVGFRHYDTNPEPHRLACMYFPQSYRFEKGRTYIIFAKKHTPNGPLRQVWTHHTTKGDEGSLLCGDDKPVAGATVKDIYWAELTALLASTRAGDATYALGQLDQMSGAPSEFGFGYSARADFDRKEVLALEQKMMTHPDPKIAQAAIRLLGSGNPYLSDVYALYWLNAVGGAVERNSLGMDPAMQNEGGAIYWKDLIAVAEGNAAGETRAAAIRALGLVREPAILHPLGRWLADPSPAVRSSSALLLADFPGPETQKRLAALAGDAVPEVRVCAARAAGFMQQAAMADVMASLLKDVDQKVRQAAAMSLLSYSPKDETIAAVFKANVDNEEFKPLFLNALARENATPYLEALSQVVKEDTMPANWWGGSSPRWVARDILFKYVQAQPAGNVRVGALDGSLDALEVVEDFGPSQVRDLYAFYLQRGMPTRAAKFRLEAIRKTEERDRANLTRELNALDANPLPHGRD